MKCIKLPSYFISWNLFLINSVWLCLWFKYVGFSQYSRVPSVLSFLQRHTQQYSRSIMDGAQENKEVCYAMADDEYRWHMQCSLPLFCAESDWEAILQSELLAHLYPRWIKTLLTHPTGQYRSCPPFILHIANFSPIYSQQKSEYNLLSNSFPCWCLFTLAHFSSPALSTFISVLI